MDVVIDGMVVAEEVTMVDACTGLITVGRGEATVVGINISVVTKLLLFGLRLPWQRYNCRSVGPQELSHYHYQRLHTEIRRLRGATCDVSADCVLYSLSSTTWRGLTPTLISETEWSDGSHGPTPATAGRARH